MNSDSLAAIQADLQQQTYVSDVEYPKALVDNLNKNIQRISCYSAGCRYTAGTGGDHIN